MPYAPRILDRIMDVFNIKIAQFRDWNPKVHCSDIPKTLKIMLRD